MQGQQGYDDKIKLINFGCKVNLYDGQVILQKLRKERINGEKIFIVNTCTVTEKAAKDCQKEVSRISRKNSDAKIIVTGCDATINNQKYKNVHNVLLFFNFEREKIVNELKKQPIANNEDDVECKMQNVELNNKLEFKVNKNYRAKINQESLEKVYGKTRAFLKIEDGCDLFCSFCVIPYVRGLPVSKPIDKILEEIQVLLDNGYKEIVISGIHLGCFGKDLKDGTNLAKLVGKLKMFSKYDFRFRLSSIEIQEIDDELMDTLNESPNFCPHFHLPLQSGSNRILKLMNRRYVASDFVKKIEELKNKFDNPTFSTDVIIGFPSETDDDFQETVKLCENMGFFKIHIFPYSDRYITKSTIIIPKIESKIIKERYRILSKLEEKNMQKCYEQFINKECRVLIEQFVEKENAYFGYTERYLRSLTYYNSSYDDIHNNFIIVKPSAVKDKHLIAYSTY